MSPRLGETIGNFRLVSSIGRGGMGEVYRAVHADILTEVAVKLLHSEISREVANVQRFFNEARAVARIRHAGIVKIFDVGFHRDRAYLIMELLDGESLAQRLARGRMSVTQIAELGRQIASVLDTTHRAGVTHRDLKPDNIFLVDDDPGSRERVKVLDFGIAKLAGPIATGSAPPTVGAIGTPAYMAPEQWADASQVTSAADAYSLGCVLFELGCSRPPFRAATMAEACASHLQAMPPSMRSLFPDTPPALDALVQRLLAKSPLDRPTMSEVAAELHALGGDVLPLAPTIGTWNRSPTTGATRTTLGMGTGEVHARRARRAIVGSLAGALAVATFAIITTRSSGPSALHSAPPTRDAAAAPAPPPAGSANPPAPVPAASPPAEQRVDPAPVPAAPRRSPDRRPHTRAAKANPPSPSGSPFEGIELGSDGIPTKR